MPRLTKNAASQLPDIAHRTQAQITIVGLGAGDLEEISLGGWRALTTASCLRLRTARHPCVVQLRNYVTFESFDDMYEESESFEDVYQAITDVVIQLARQPGGVTYAVPGHPWVGEATTRSIVTAAKAAELSVEVEGATSFVEPSLAMVGVDLLDGAQVADAMMLAQKHHPAVEVSLPLLIGQVYARWLASDIKLTLLNAYPSSHEVVVIRAAGTRQQEMRRVALHELDHYASYDHLTAVYVPRLPEHRSLSELQELIAHLRAPEGCPWDQEQSLESLRRDLLGECAEVLDAIDMDQVGEDNSAHVAEELGDLLAVTTMMVQIATEEGRFQMSDVVHHVITKLIRRHPHVFDNQAVAGISQVVQTWDEIKAAEKAAQGITDIHPLDGVPVHLPALEKARQLQSKAAKAGLFDHGELRHKFPELHQTLTTESNGDPLGEKVGELLWSLVAWASAVNVNAEDALRTYALQFRRAHDNSKIV